MKKNHTIHPRLFPAAFTPRALAMTYGQWRGCGGCALGRVGSWTSARSLHDVVGWELSGMTLGEILNRYPARERGLLQHCATEMDPRGRAGLVVYEECRRSNSRPVAHDRRMAA